MPQATSQPIQLELDLPAEARAGEMALLKLKVKNVSQRPVEQALGGRPCYDFIVSKPDGTEVWRWSRGQVVQDILELKTLQAGEELEFAGEWKQRDNDGNAVPAGKYLVRGVLNADPPEKLETKPKPLTITP